MKINRDEVDWSKVDNDALRMLLSLPYFDKLPCSDEIYTEVQNRFLRGDWLDLVNPPPPLETLPKWLKKWPFCLLWYQRPRMGEG
jgi:hypothetical protein